MARTRDEAAHAARQEAILDVAESLFAERGFHATGIAALCDALAMSPGALYRYFESKDEIVRALVRREADRTVARVAALRGTAHDRVTVLDLLASELLLSLRQNADPGRLAMTLEVWAEGARDPESARVLADSERAAVGALARALDDIAAVGWIAPVPAESTARWLLAVADGATLWVRPDDADAERGLRAIVAALLPPPDHLPGSSPIGPDSGAAR